MNTYQQCFIAQANAAKVYAALTTLDGLRGWWTNDVAGDSGLDGKIRLRFGNSHKEMQVEALAPNREVRWLCTAAHINHDSLTRTDEWVGTRIVFHLSPEGAEHTRVDFEHIGLVPSFECYELCNNGWNYFLKSLHEFVETGKGTPFENGEKCEEKIAVGSN